MNTTLKSILAFSIAASLIFSNAATINAGHKNDWSHSHAYGHHKHDKHQSKHNFKHNSHKSNQKYEKVNKHHKHEDKKPVYKHQAPAPTPKKVVKHKYVPVKHTQQDMHCVNHNAQNVVKVTSSKNIIVDEQPVNVSIKGTKVFFKDLNGTPITATFCIKASTKNSGVLTGTKGEVNFLNKGQKCPDISYVAIYNVVKPTVVNPSPVVTPSAQPTITPTPKEQGQTLSTNTKKTEILGTKVERSTGNELPNTGGTSKSTTQAVGLFLIVAGLATALARKA